MTGECLNIPQSRSAVCIEVLGQIDESVDNSIVAVTSGYSSIIGQSYPESSEDKTYELEMSGSLIDSGNLSVCSGFVYILDGIKDSHVYLKITYYNYKSQKEELKYKIQLANDGLNCLVCRHRNIQATHVDFSLSLDNILCIHALTLIANSSAEAL